MIKNVEILEMYDLMRDLFDHEIAACEKTPDTLSISTILARECNKVGVVDIQRSGMPLMKTKFCKNSAAENDILGCFNSRYNSAYVELRQTRDCFLLVLLNLPVPGKPYN